MNKVNIDADDNADWTKQTWDLPFAYGSEAFLDWLDERGMTLAEFKKTPTYRFALASGSIKEST